MKILLGECIPRKFKNSFPGHDCSTVPENGYAGQKNGELLRLAETAGFEIFITLDRGLEYEQNLQGRKIAVIFLRARSSRLADLLPLVSEVLRAIHSIRSGGLVTVG